VSEIERTKISEEWLIDKILIDAEIVCTWLVPWSLLIRDPVEFIYVLWGEHVPGMMAKELAIWGF
jgi:hypothetical protein